MPVFHYKAVSPHGEEVEGQREDVDEAAVIRWIQGSGLIPLHAERTEGSGRRFTLPSWKMGRRALSSADLAALTEELSVLLKAGIALEEALSIARNASESPAVGRVLDRILEQVRNGASFSVALASASKVFSPFYINIVKTSEAAGTLGPGLGELSAYLQRERELKDEIVSATLYPLVLFVVALISIALILVFVVPKISALFVGYEEMLPLSTIVVIASAEFVATYWWAMLLGVLGGLLWIRHRLQMPVGRLRWDRRLLGLPVLGDLIAKIEVARFSRSMATMLGNGVPLMQALPLASGAMSNRVLSDLTRQGTEILKDGGSFSAIFAGAACFPTLALQLIKVGEQTGDLEGMLAKVAEIYEAEASKAARRMLSILEPVLIVGLGLVIGGIIMSIMVAIISVNELPL